jgi:DNA polymerase-3 subunit delta'
MIWTSVIGQDRVKKQIVEIIRSGRLAHAYLFHGPDGVGKDAVAMELARVLLCERGELSACGTCSSCLKVRLNQHPDVWFIISLPRGKNEESDDPPMEKLSAGEVALVQEQLRLKGGNPYHRIVIPRSNVIKANSIRALRKGAALSTFSGRYRIVIISHAEEMSEEASNMLLKTLEEPGKGALFILTSSHPELLLPTIRSRCQLVRFDSLSAEEIQDALVGRGLAEAHHAALIARLALGSYTRAIDLLDEDIGNERREALEFIMNALGSSFIALVDQIQELTAGKDRDKLIRFLNLLLIWFRDALVLREEGEIISVDQRDELTRFVKRFPNANIRHLLEEIENAITSVERNVYMLFVLIQLSLRLKDLVHNDETRVYLREPIS